MDTLTVLHVLRPATGGMRRHVELLCRGLRAVGVTSDVAAPSRMKMQAPPGGRLVAVDIAARTTLLADLSAALRLGHAARSVDVIHGHGLRGAWIAGLATRRARRPLVVTLHNLAPRSGPLARAAMRWALGPTTRVIAVSGAVARSASSMLCTSSEVQVIQNGVDAEWFAHGPGRSEARSALGLPQGEPVVGAVGRLSPEKGFDLLLDALSLLSRSAEPPTLLLVGTGAEQLSLQGRIEELGLGGRARLLGHLQDVRIVYAAADAIAVPSRQEGQGLVALEAMASGRIVVASAVGGLTETIDDGRTGLLVAPGDAGRLAEGISDALSRPDRDAIVGAARQEVLERYTLAAMIDSTAAVYRACAAAGAPRWGAAPRPPT